MFSHFKNSNQIGKKSVHVKTFNVHVYLMDSEMFWEFQNVPKQFRIHYLYYDRGTAFKGKLYSKRVVKKAPDPSLDYSCL